jgi:hypothetical protein
MPGDIGFYQRYVIPRLTHLAMRQKQLLPVRQRVIGAAEGRVLEIGIGSGLNFPLYGGAVTSVIGLEPSRHASGRGAHTLCPQRPHPQRRPGRADRRLDGLGGETILLVLSRWAPLQQFMVFFIC